jgi:hypothetical protein
VLGARAAAGVVIDTPATRLLSTRTAPVFTWEHSSTRRGAASTTTTTRHSPSPGRRAFKVASPSPLRVRTRRPLTLVRPPNCLPLPSSPAKGWKQTVGSLGFRILPSRRRAEALAAARRKLEGVPGPRQSQWAVLEDAEVEVRRNKSGKLEAK